MWTQQLQCKGRVVAARTVFVGDNLPELGADLVAALATLDCNELTHDFCARAGGRESRHEERAHHGGSGFRVGKGEHFERLFILHLWRDVTEVGKNGCLLWVIRNVAVVARPCSRSLHVHVGFPITKFQVTTVTV